jgi:hypothetical protein
MRSQPTHKNGCRCIQRFDGNARKLKKLKEVPNQGPTSVTNALFVGSTTELTKLLKEKK